MSRDPAGAALSSANQRIQCFCRTRLFSTPACWLVAGLVLCAGTIAGVPSTSAIAIKRSLAWMDFIEIPPSNPRRSSIKPTDSGEGVREYDSRLALAFPLGGGFGFVFRGGGDLWLFV